MNRRHRRRKPSLHDTFGAMPTLDLPPGMVVNCASGDSERLFNDDVATSCAGCGIEVYHRPYIPAHLTKLCVTCGLRWGRPPEDGS